LLVNLGGENAGQVVEHGRPKAAARDALIAATNAWALEKPRPLGGKILDRRQIASYCGQGVYLPSYRPPRRVA
jgi:hypothetical protein